MSNTLARGNLPQFGSEKIARSGHKNEDISESVNSFCIGAIFPGYFRSQAIQKCIRCVCICAVAKYLMEQRFLHETEIFEKVLSPSDLLKIFGPAGGSAPGKVLRLSKGNSYVNK